MQLIVSAKKMNVPAATREHIEHRLRFALSRFALMDPRVQVVLSDENGPRGGVDKLCRIVVGTRHLGEIAAEGRAASVEAALDAAADRVGRAVARSARRRQWQRTNRVRRVSAAGEQD